jgi:Rrf2 family protein
MKISQKGLYALQAIMMLARHHEEGAIPVRDIAEEENLPAKFLELILLDLKHACLLDSVRGNKGGYKLRRDPADIRLSELIRLIDGPLAPLTMWTNSARLSPETRIIVHCTECSSMFETQPRIFSKTRRSLILSGAREFKLGIEQAPTRNRGTEGTS